MGNRRWIVILAVLFIAGCASLIPPGMNAPDLSRIEIGMTAIQVQDAIGPPQSINSTMTATDRHEQWVYTQYDFSVQTLIPVAYLYFDNGVLVAIQD